MDQSEQHRQHAGTSKMAYTSAPYQNAPIVASPTQPPSSFSNAPDQLAYQQAPHIHHQQQEQQQQLQMFWANQMQEIDQTTDFKNHNLPLARIKKIVKADEDVRMISSEAPVVVAKACEMFVLELTLRSWIHTEENKRRTLQKNDIAAAISRTDVFDFLVDIAPRDELKDEGLGVTKVSIPTVGPPADLPYFYVPLQHPAVPVRPTMSFMPWPHYTSSPAAAIPAVAK